MDSDGSQIQQSEMAALLGPDPAPFETLISHLMSSSNEQRSQAEAAFNLCRQSQPDSLILKLAHVLQFSPHPGFRAMSSILLRKLLTPYPSDEVVVDELDKEDSSFSSDVRPCYSSVEEILISYVEGKSTVETTYMKLCNAILHFSDAPFNDWRGLLLFMSDKFSSDSRTLELAHLLQFSPHPGARAMSTILVHKLLISDTFSPGLLSRRTTRKINSSFLFRDSLMFCFSDSVTKTLSNLLESYSLLKELHTSKRSNKFSSRIPPELSSGILFNGLPELLDFMSPYYSDSDTQRLSDFFQSYGILPDNGGPELFPPMVQCASSVSPNSSYDFSPNSSYDSSSSSWYVWPGLSPASQSSLKAILLSSLQRESTKSISNKLCDTISMLASSILPDNGWPELLPFMFQCISSDFPNLQESAFLIFAQLSQFIGHALVPHINDLHSVFLNCLSNSPSYDVRIAALSAVINFIPCLETSSQRDRFQDLLPAMMTTLARALNSSQEANAQEALKLLIELAGAEPRFLLPRLDDVFVFMLKVAEAGWLEEGTRHLAIEFVITLAEDREHASGMMRMLPELITRLFKILMNMLLDIEDDPAWHTAEVEDEDAGETSNFSVAQQCLYRLFIALGSKPIVPVASELLPDYLAASEWKYRHAGLIALAQIAEGCSNVNLKLVYEILSLFQYPYHPRVLWAAIKAIEQLCIQLGPDLPTECCQRVMEEVAGAMDDFNNPRVQACATSAVINFSENCPQHLVNPYMSAIVSKLLNLLQNGKQLVQERALTALASIVDQHFQENYDASIPHLKAILVTATNISNQMLIAKAMKCFFLLDGAVNKEKFRDDAKQVTEVLMSQGPQMEFYHPRTRYIMKVPRIARDCNGQLYEWYFWWWDNVIIRGFTNKF